MRESRDCNEKNDKKYKAITRILDIAQHCNTPRQMRIKNVVISAKVDFWDLTGSRVITKNVKNVY